MKALKLFSILALAALAGCSPRSAEAPGPRETVISKLQAAVDNGAHLYTMQDALCYGRDWHPANAEDRNFERCDIFALTGDYPAMVGFDLGGIEIGESANLDGVDFGYMRAAAVSHASKGGLVTFSWHLRNPLTGGDAWDVSSDQVVKSVLEGGENHEKFMGWLERAADFLESCTLEDGRLIPIIFRPWHENTGSWFWWGAGLCSREDYLALWTMTYGYLAEERGLDMAWAYSPSSTLLKEEAIARYPGDKIIDIIGVDRYADAHEMAVNPSYIEGMQGDMEYLGAFAKDHSLLLAVTETGQEGQSCATWWTEELLPAIEGQPVSYVLTWRNAWDPGHPGHWFSAFKGAADETDFLKYYKSDKTYFLNDIQ